jgi:trans-aconitate methyltransferase
MSHAELFDLTAQYDAMLERGLRLSGEDRRFFIDERLRDLRGHMPGTSEVRRILDFGCGLGDTSGALADQFPGAHVVGADTSEAAIEHAREQHAGARVAFVRVDDLDSAEPFDLCYCNGVFHHIDPADRPAAVGLIHASLAAGGLFALYENNPWNVGTRWVMRRIPFDRGAQALGAGMSRRLLASAGFSRLAPTRFLFVFPRWLKLFRFCEPWLAHWPLGAQYCVTGIK